MEELILQVNIFVWFCRYAYPPPDGNILTNIVNALIAVPRFYTQVLVLLFVIAWCDANQEIV